MSTVIAPAKPVTAVALVDDCPERFVELREQCSFLSDADLLEAIAKKLSLTAESLGEAAFMVRLAEERGIDTRPVVNGMVPILRKIAYGQILPQLVVYCATNAKLLQLATRLAIPDQRQLIESQAIEFAEGEDLRMVDPRTATNRQLKQLFNDDRIRPLHEQRRWLFERQQPKKKGKVKPAVTRASEVSEDDMTTSITVAVTPEWDAAIRIMAKENGWPLKYAATRFLISLGKK